MIERVEISNWKAFDARGVNFSPGLNLILGRNAAGKSTLLEAICLALVGESSELPDFKASVRDKHMPAKIKLILDSGTSVERTFNAERVIGASLVRNGIATTLTWDQATSHLEELLGANRQFIKRLAYVSEGAIFRYLLKPPGDAVEGQLERLFGIDNLQRYLADFHEARTQFHREAEEVQDVWKDIEIPPDLDAQLRAVEVKLADLDKKVGDARRNLGSLTREIAELDALERSQTRIHELLRQLPGVFEGAGLPLDRTRSVHDLANILFDIQSVALTQATESLNALRQQISYAEGRMEYLDDLEKIATDAKRAMQARPRMQKCPICKRPLEDRHITEILRDVSEERAKQQAARAAAGEQMAFLSKRVQLLDDQRSRGKQVMTELSAYTTQLRANSPQEIEAFLTDLSKRAIEMRKKLAKLQAESGALDLQVKQDIEIKTRLESQRQMSALVRTQRTKQIQLRAGEFLSELLDDAISQTIMRERETNLAAIRSTLSDLWSKFRGGSEETVEFLPSGEMSVVRGSTKLAFSQLSGGEKTALLVLSQTVASRALSNLDFLLIDEPLEHLDLGNRRSLMSFLAQAAKQNFIKQLIVTTFEESLVRKYLEGPSVRPIYI